MAHERIPRRIAALLAATIAAAASLSACTGLPLFSSWSQVVESRDGYVVLRASQLPVYTSLDDRPGVSRCNGSCLRFFKPVERSGAMGSRIPSFKRADGIEQVEYLGRPLYTSVLDQPGGAPRAHRIHDGWLVLQAL